MSGPPPTLDLDASLASEALRDDISQLIESLQDGVLFLDREWRITYANQEGRRISRIEPQHINGPSHWELYPESVGSPFETMYRECMDQHISQERELFYEPFDLWVALRTIPIPNGIAIHYRDISRVKRAETARDESAGRLQQVLEVTSDAVVLLDRNYTITFLNRRGRELISPDGSIVGRNLWTCFPEARFEGSPFVTTYDRAMNEGMPGYFETFYPAPLNLWLSIDARPADDGIIIFFRDITAQRAAAEELRRKSDEAARQAAEIETVYRTAPIGLALFDTVDFRYLRLNDRQAAFFGMKPEEIVGQAVTDLAPIPGLKKLFEQVRDGRPVVNYALEGEVVSHPGEHRFWTVNYFPLYAPDGSVQAIAAASLEVTQQKKAEQALIQSEKLAAVGRLASSISHEINNPLESVTNLLYLIASHEDLSPPTREYVSLAQSELARVSQIAQQTLRFHRQTARATLVTAAQLVQPVLDLYNGRLLNSGIEVAPAFPSSTPILCLENEIRQVLNNLIGNAIDAMRTGGHLVVRSHDAVDFSTGRKGIRIVVSDTGHGMSPETMRRIFEPFFTTKDLNGTGLGLWISTEIVQRHKGRLSVRSSQVPAHQGTVFSLFLPFNEEPVHATPAAPAQA